MNWVDFTALAIVVLPALSGLRHGLVAGLLKLGALGLFLGLAIWQMPVLVRFAMAYLPLGSSAAPVAAIVASLVVGWLFGALAAVVWKKLSEGSVAWTDRLLGCLSGAVKGAAVAVCAMVTLAAVWPTGRQAIEKSWISRNVMAPVLEEGRARLATRLGLAAPEAP
ncbi:MAG: CvpA family protein [Fibrobacterota bacterium]|nr:CvpA family protein [Fibrobacterota bacterium]QQS07085.1 MAG: CvpA family protein [Fibrobacterota bacterium]